MDKAQFLNQKLGKRTSRRMNLEKARLRGLQRAGNAGVRVPKKGSSREVRSGR
jgi:hypothetical protein